MSYLWGGAGAGRKMYGVWVIETRVKVKGRENVNEKQYYLSSIDCDSL